MCVCLFVWCNCMRRQKIPLYMYGHKCGEKTEGEGVKCARVWAVEERGEYPGAG